MKIQDSWILLWRSKMYYLKRKHAKLNLLGIHRANRWLNASYYSELGIGEKKILMLARKVIKKCFYFTSSSYTQLPNLKYKKFKTNNIDTEFIKSQFLFSSIYIRRKYWIRENFRLPVFDGFTCLEMSWTWFDHF